MYEGVEPYVFWRIIYNKIKSAVVGRDAKLVWLDRCSRCPSFSTKLLLDTKQPAVNSQPCHMDFEYLPDTGRRSDTGSPATLAAGVKYGTVSTGNFGPVALTTSSVFGRIIRG